VKIGQPRFITLEEAAEFHRIGIETFGGSPDIRDVGLLDSALAQPRTGFGGEHAHEFPFGMAAAYAFHIAKNHPCVDGNKRLALMCCVTFLRMNGWNLAPGGTAAADRLIELVTDRMTKAQFADWLRDHCADRVSLELRDFVHAVTFDMLESHAAGAQAGSTDLRIATFDEAAANIPLVAELVLRKDAAIGSGDRAAAEFLSTIAITMVSLYRIAEDMGYDW
jgi:death on curing protein